MKQQINLNLDSKIFSPTLYPYLLDYSKRFNLYKGSAGSGKSYFITQKILIRAMKEKIKVLVCRKYGTTIRNTCFALFKEVLSQWKLTPYVKIRETDFDIQLPNGSEIIFSGLDEETKLLSLTGITVIFVEEVYEVEQSIWEQLNLRLRGGKNQQIYGAFNPISKNHWLYAYCVENPPEDLFFSETTYKDNPFLDEAYIKALEELESRDPQKYNVYALGNWGSDPEGRVFSNWRVEEFDPMELSASGLELRVGSDLGYIDPTTIVCSLYDRPNSTIYVFDEFYKPGCQLDEVAKAMGVMGIGRHQKIWMDAAEPRTIEYFRRSGYNAIPCIKGRDSVKARISFLQNNKIIIRPTCENVIAEFENFSYVKDKHTDKYTEDTTHEWSHAIDGLGYAYSDIYTNNKLRTIDKSLLGL